MLTGNHKCRLCNKTLASDLREVHLAISQELLEKHGLVGAAPIPKDAPVLIFLCPACGHKEGAPTMHQMTDDEQPGLPCVRCPINLWSFLFLFYFRYDSSTS
jgi:hypothetical protein